MVFTVDKNEMSDVLGRFALLLVRSGIPVERVAHNDLVFWCHLDGDNGWTPVVFEESRSC